MKKILGVLVASIFLLGGCAIKEEQQYPKQFRLQISLKKQNLRNIPLNSVLKVQRISGESTALSRAVLYTDGVTLMPFRYAKWSELPSTRLQEIFAESLEQSNIFQAVITSRSHALADFLLEGTLYHFEEEYLSDGQARVHVALRFYLVERKSSKIMASKLFEMRQIVKGKNTNATVSAFNAALTKISDSLNRWVNEQTQR